MAECQPDPPVAVVIPPPSTAVPCIAAGTTPSQRNQHIHPIRNKGRVETAIFRHKAAIGSSLRTRTLPAPKTKAKVARLVLNRMNRLGMLTSQRIA